MRTARKRYDKNSCYYHLFNRVAGEKGWHPFGEVEREMMLKIIRQLNKFYTIDIISFVAMGNHFHLIVRTPSSYPSVKEVDKHFRAYYGNRREPPDWCVADNYLKYAGRMRDMSALMKDFQQQFTHWFNKTRKNERRGGLWADRFKSVILESGKALWECLQYVEMNPVRAKLSNTPGDYRHSTWGWMSQTGKHLFGVDLTDHLGVLQWENSNSSEIADQLTTLMQMTIEREGTGQAANRKLNFGLNLHRRVRHWTEGAIIGSHLFVKNMTAEFYGLKRARIKRFDDSGQGIVSFRQLRIRKT